MTAETTFCRLDKWLQRLRLKGMRRKLESISIWAACCDYIDVVGSIEQTRNLIRQKIKALNEQN